MIRVERRGRVGLLTLDRPQKKNALTGEMYAGLAEALEAGNGDETLGCHVIAGQPGAFTAGNDIADFLQSAMGGDMSGAPVIRFLRALVGCEKPIVAAVDGLAIGVGTTLLFHCDMVFATEASLFKTPFLDLGLVPEAGASLLGPQRMGHARAFELLCLGEGFSAERAREAGIVNHIVAAEDLLPRAIETAEAIAAKPAEAMRISRSLLMGDRTALRERMEEEIRLFAERLTSREAMAAFTAFMQKSKA
ncbi:crotonase/enoyl-CoA hydratase family protein [Stappia sp. F7233]|uniref:Crotonase/enoyl-CoA hydratase family protein n=1 Tax=Stappia albiluteola TaxID=2758565 RepID=A0A839A9W3_9HYPH|nr:crotonase/enoyl-CoA hydratase family protein [Stappia albiluteola]MBA5776343.1 crotonase/enoyl-CoA hydratase family protein [Stappia albiluteola]